MVDHEVVATEPIHFHAEDVAYGDDATVEAGASEHVGPIEISVALGIGQDLEDDGGRCFDPP
jgi:hypothetical protein